MSHCVTQQCRTDRYSRCARAERFIPGSLTRDIVFVQWTFGSRIKLKIDKNTFPTSEDAEFTRVALKEAMSDRNNGNIETSVASLSLVLNLLAGSDITEPSTTARH